MLRITEGKRAQGKILLEVKVESWDEAREKTLAIARQQSPRPITMEYGDMCQVVTL